MTLVSGVVTRGISNKGFFDDGVVAASNIVATTATALTVARAGTDYGLQVDESTANAVTGLLVKPAAAAAGLALSVQSTGTDEALTLDAKGAGTLTLNGTGTGAVTAGHGLTVTAGGFTVTAGGLTLSAGQAALTLTRSVASGSSADLVGVKVAATTITVTGGTQVTAAQGMVNIGRPTLTDSSALTVDTYASLYIANSPTVGGMVTLTAAYALWVDAGVTRLDGGLNLAAGASTVTVVANTASALLVSDGTVSVLAFDTRNTVTGVTTALFTSPSMTIAGASGSTYSQVGIAPKTVTTSTQTTITALDGLALTVGTQTVAQSGGAVTVTTASALYVKKLIAGSMVTITNNYIINTDVNGCFLTAAGVWTDASSFEHKQEIVTVLKGRALELLADVRAVTYRYRAGHSDGLDTERFGVIAEQVPEFLASPDHKGVGSIHLAGYLLAVVKDLAAELAETKRQISALQGA